jgi:hypothetical protein
MTEKQQQPEDYRDDCKNGLARCPPQCMTSSGCPNLNLQDFDGEPETYPQNTFCKCPYRKHPNIIPLTPALTAYYTERSQATGKPITQLVLQDLAALHRKRVAREEKRVWKEIEYERL